MQSIIVPHNYTRRLSTSNSVATYVQLLHNYIHSYMLFLQMGDTPLHVTLQSWHYRSDKVVEALIKGGADVNITNKVSN